MTRLDDAEVEAQKKRWHDLSVKWMDDLWLANWAVTYHWLLEPLDGRLREERNGKPTTSTCDTRDGIPAHVYVQWQYQTADVEIDLRIVEMLSDHELERLFLHEMMHVVLGGMGRFRSNAKAYKDIEEYTATWLAKVLLWVRSHQTDQIKDQMYAPESPSTALQIPATTNQEEVQRIDC